MNDRHSAGIATPPEVPQEADAFPFGTYDQGVQHHGYGGYGDQGGHINGSFATGYDPDPLYGGPAAPSDGVDAYDGGTWAAAPATYPDGVDTSAHAAFGGYETYPAQQQAYDTGATDSYATGGGWEVHGYPLGGLPEEAQPGAVPSVDTGQWQTQQFAGATYDTGSFAPQEFAVTGTDSGAYDATAWNSAGAADATLYDAYPAYDGQGTSEPYGQPGPTGSEGYPAPAPASFDQQETICAGLDTSALLEHDATSVLPALTDTALTDTAFGDTERGAEDVDSLDMGPVVLSQRTAPGGRPRSRRRTPAGRTPAKRSALLTVAVPSACVMGVAGIAAASVGLGSDSEDKETTVAAPEVAPVKPSVVNSKLDTQIAGLSADAGDFADRASRTQERIDFKVRQEAERKRAAEEAARKERLRPKFALPVDRNGLSAYYGQAGINWMSLHTGIDFPVGYGTPVKAATDGTVRTQINPAYGNMVILTAKDGTETWYCHLSRYTVVNGPVKAGDVIAYSGDSGNSTGPHLHFEVRPGGGSPVDPLAWFRSHGLDPT
ncbi:peptidoglycan DD-metalloendopeptidase family protein [Streptomyces sp. NPDC002454]